MGKAADGLSRLSAGHRRLPEEMVRLGVRRVGRATNRALTADTGGDKRLSGVRNGRPQRIRTVRRRAGILHEGWVLAGPRNQRAPLFWREEGTRGGRRGARVGRFEGSTSRRSYRGNHPGTDGTQWWSTAVEPALEATERDFERLWRGTLR